MQESFYLSFKTLPGEPYIPMDQSFSLGSEVGDYLIKSHDIASRHCLFEAKQNVVTITDLGSSQGTWVQGIKLEPGKTTILLPGDQITLGHSVVVDFIVAKEINPAFHLHHWDEVEKRYHQKEIHAEKQVKQNKQNKKATSVEPVISTEPTKEPSSLNDASKIEKTKTKVKIKKEIRNLNLAGPIRRLFAFLIDLLASATVMSLIETTSIAESLSQLSTKVFTVASHSLLNVVFEYLCIFSIYIILTTALLKVSLGQKLLGIKADSRFNSILRSIIAVVTTPILIFDLALLFDKRSLKEVVTRSPLLREPKFYWIKSLIGAMIVIFLFMVSPLLKGGRVYSSYVIETAIQKSDEKLLGQSNKVRRHNLFSLSLSHPKELATRLPYIDKDSKGVKLLDLKNRRQAVITLHQKINIQRLLRGAFNKDPLLSKFYPFLSRKLNGDIFSQNWSYTDKIKYQSELFDLLKTSFHLSFSTYFKHIMSRGPFVSSYTYLKKSLTQYVDDFDNIEALQTPSATIYFFSKSGVAEKQIAFPLSFQEEIQSLKLTPGDGSNLDMMERVSRDQYFAYADWNSKQEDLKTPYTAESLVELILKLQKKELKMTKNYSRNIYQYFFETAKKLMLLNAKPESFEVVTLSYIEALKNTDEVEHISTLTQRLKELLVRLKANDKEFWGIES